jgi:hypothetical protein
LNVFLRHRSLQNEIRVPALWIDELVLVRENAFVVPGLHFAGAATPFADVALQAAFKAERGVGVDKDGQLKAAAQGSAMEKPKPFENDNIARFEESFTNIARVRGKIVFRNATDTATANVSQAFFEGGPIERFGIVEINFGALSGREVREIFVK